MKPTEQLEIEKGLKSSLLRIKDKLKDSPISWGLQKEHSIGFYHGFCQAKEWAADCSFLSELECL